MMDKILAAVALIMGAPVPQTDIGILQVSPSFMAKATLRTGVGATVIPTGNGYLIMTTDPTRKEWIAHELCHVIQYERGDDMRRIHRVEKECYRVQAMWARQNGVRGQSGHVPGTSTNDPENGPDGGQNGGNPSETGVDQNGHQDNGNHYGNDRDDNNSHDQNNKHNEA